MANYKSDWELDCVLDFFLIHNLATLGELCFAATGCNMDAIEP